MTRVVLVCGLLLAACGGDAFGGAEATEPDGGDVETGGAASAGGRAGSGGRPSGGSSAGGGVASSGGEMSPGAGGDGSGGRPSGGASSAGATGQSGGQGGELGAGGKQPDLSGCGMWACNGNADCPVTGGTPGCCAEGHCSWVFGCAARCCVDADCDGVCCGINGYCGVGC